MSVSEGRGRVVGAVLPVCPNNPVVVGAAVVPPNLNVLVGAAVVLLANPANPPVLDVAINGLRWWKLAWAGAPLPSAVPLPFGVASLTSTIFPNMLIGCDSMAFWAPPEPFSKVTNPNPRDLCCTMSIITIAYNHRFGMKMQRRYGAGK